MPVEPGAGGLPLAGMSDTTFVCPRCGREVDERFWGPCSQCRTELVGLMGAEPEPESEQVETSRFEPTMNVVPNHVATKD
jgi:hypothetical protein